MKLTEIPCPVNDCKAYRTGNNLAVICGQEFCGPHGELRWHISVSHAKRNPTWEEIHDLRYRLIPDDAMMVMFLPPKWQYVDLHRYCFHLFEISEEEAPRIIA